MMNKGGNRDTTRMLMDRSVSGRVGVITPGLDVPAAPLPDAAYLRDSLPLPEVSEPEVVQYFTVPEPAQLQHRHPLLPAGVVHHEVQPQDQR